MAKHMKKEFKRGLMIALFLLVALFAIPFILKDFALMIITQFSIGSLIVATFLILWVRHLVK